MDEHLFLPAVFGVLFIFSIFFCCGPGGGDLRRRQSPTLPVDVEDDTARIAKLALEIVVIGVAEIKEKFAARCLDLLLLLFEIVALETEMMNSGS